MQKACGARRGAASDSQVGCRRLLRKRERKIRPQANGCDPRQEVAYRHNAVRQTRIEDFVEEGGEYGAR